MKEDRKYKVRYQVEDWNKPIKGQSERVIPGVRIVTDKNEENVGYTDILFIASILQEEDDKIISILLLDSQNGSNPSKDILEAVKSAIEHHLYALTMQEENEKTIEDIVQKLKNRRRK